MANKSFDYLAGWVGDGSTTPRLIGLGYQPRAVTVIAADGKQISKTEGMLGNLALILPLGSLGAAITFDRAGLLVEPEANQAGIEYFAVCIA